MNASTPNGDQVHPNILPAELAAQILERDQVPLEPEARDQKLIDLERNEAGRLRFATARPAAEDRVP